MTIIFGTLRDVGGQLAQGTVTVSSLVTRPAHGAASTVITKERHVLPLLNGEFVSPELDPGPVLVEAASGGAFESWEVMLPEDGRHDLATLIETHVEYAPSVVGRVEAAAQAAGQSATRAAEAEQRVSLVVASAADVVRGELQVQVDGASQARVGAELARDGAVDARDAAVGAAGGVAADAVAAGDAAGRAEVAADAADASATAAGVSAGEAAASATAAQGHAEDAAGDAATASGARDGAVSAADSAQGGATAAAEDADRAEAAAAGVDKVVSDAAGVLAGELADDVAASQAARSGAESARDQAVGAASQAATEAGAAAQIAAAEKIADLVGSAPADLDTIYELAAAFADRGDAIAAIQSALANRVVGNHTSVIASTAPGAGTPTNQVTFVVEGE